MTVHLCTFSDESMSRAAQLCVESGLDNGVTSAATWNRQKIEDSQYADEERCLTLELMDRGARGAGGWWCWKPYIIHDVLCRTSSGHIIYSDAGVEFIAPVSHIIERMDEDIFLFGNNWEHAHWCKRDVIDAVWPLEYALAHSKGGLALMYPLGSTYNEQGELVLVPPLGLGLKQGLHWDMFGKQCQASVIFFRVSDYTRAFVAEWLKWCLFEGGRLIDDSPSRLPNHPEFREHRHDQAILTTMAYREGIRLHYWPAVYNKGGSPEFIYEKLPEYAGDDYPVLFSHHRRRNHEWEQMA